MTKTLKAIGLLAFFIVVFWLGVRVGVAHMTYNQKIYSDDGQTFYSEYKGQVHAYN